ncbi:synchronized import protein 1 [Podospora fimiseda]|uniref:Synchronized import protein 1 n=1 Tax=Podospora fimiseda TaxID=252190 RepID=A0AAN7BQX7_9PEZI|nr:synchronized import protein 1 [Podospora fimiseda]
MAKSQRKRVRPGRADPISKPVKPPCDPELAKLREDKILPVLKDLQNPDAKLRTQAAGAIANIVEDAKCRKLLLREKVVHIVLTETLTDNSIDSRAAGWYILKVLAQEEQADFCVHLFRLDILTALDHAVKAIIDTLMASEPAFSKLLKAQQRIVWEMTTSIIALINILGMAKEEIATAIVANQNITRLIFRLTSTDIAPQEVYEEAFSCLTTLSEDSLELGQAITNDQETHCYDVLLKLASGTGPKAVLACGVLHNVFTSLQWFDHSPGKDGASDAVLVRGLVRALEQVTSTSLVSNGVSTSVGITQLALEILASIGTDLREALEKGNRPQPKAPGTVPAAEEDWNGIEDDVDAMDVDEESGAVKDEADEDDAEDEEIDEDDEGETDDDDDDDIADLEEDMERVTGVDDFVEEGGLDDLPTLGSLIQQAIPQLVRLANLPIDNEESFAVQSHAISALNNISWTISCIEFAGGENDNIFEAWYPAAKKIWQKVISPILEADNADLELATQVTSLAWAVARSLNGKTPLSGNQHRKFMSLYHVSKNLNAQQQQQTEGGEQEDPMQGLGVKCIGVLGALARDPAPLDVNREIGVFLITLIDSADKDKTIPPADIVEALNQIFDIYGDEQLECDKAVFWKDGFLKHLEEFLPKLKTQAKGIDKRAQTELRTRTDEAIVNLERFVRYKKKHVPK